MVHIDFIKYGKDSLLARAKNALVTTSLGALHSDSVKFELELPFSKQQVTSDMHVSIIDKLAMYWDDYAIAEAPNFSDKWEEVSGNGWFDLVTPETKTSSVCKTFLNNRHYNGLHTTKAWIGSSSAETMEGVYDAIIVE